jgi:ubiquinone/menaquinone biosynthesis C-methylase UbiE
MKAASKVKLHFEEISSNYDNYKDKNWYYYSWLKKLIKSLIPMNSIVMEIGCGTGDIITGLKPRQGIGLDISEGMINIARGKHKEVIQVKFLNQPIQTFYSKIKFNYVLLCDVIEHLEERKRAFKRIHSLMGKNSYLVITMANPAWELLLMAGEKLKLKMPEGPHDRISSQEVIMLLSESNFKIIENKRTLLLPIWIPVLSNIINIRVPKQLEKYAFIEYFVAVKKDK